jgi:NtrC-family two-component system response regulator AlgB
MVFLIANAIFATGHLLGVVDLPGRITVSDSRIPAGKVASIAVGGPVTLEELEAEHIRLILSRTPSREDAARILGIDPSTLYRKRKQLGL